MKRCFLLLATTTTLLQMPWGSISAQSRSSSAESFVAVRDEWIENWKSRNLNGLCKLYAADATFLPAIGTEIHGRDAICNYLGEILEHSAVNASFAQSDAADAHSADVAYDSGVIVYWIKKTVAPIKGSYLVVFRRDSNGDWQIARQAFAGIAARYPNEAETSR
jgi:uncharacterized protein (TIGR02246 family)